MGSRAGMQAPSVFLSVVGAHTCLEFGNTVGFLQNASDQLTGLQAHWLSAVRWSPATVEDAPHRPPPHPPGSLGPSCAPSWEQVLGGLGLVGHSHRQGGLVLVDPVKQSRFRMFSGPGDRGGTRLTLAVRCDTCI